MVYFLLVSVDFTVLIELEMRKHACMRAVMQVEIHLYLVYICRLPPLILLVLPLVHETQYGTPYKLFSRTIAGDLCVYILRKGDFVTHIRATNGRSMLSHMKKLRNYSC
jgi:hypothetical protein